MKAIVTPCRARGEVGAPPSKSAAHRAMICAALANAPTRIALGGMNEDMAATLAALDALCAKVTGAQDAVLIAPQGFKQGALIDCAESGSTLRFMLPVAWALGGASLIGRGRLPMRPLGALFEQMVAHGAHFSGDRLPFTVSGTARGGTFVLPGDVSSQFVTGLLLAAPLFDEDVRVTIVGTLQSRPYVDMTLRVMRDFGVVVKQQGQGFFVQGGQRYQSPAQVNIEGDWSGAAFMMALGALGGEVTVSGLDWTSAQGDRAMAALLQKMGARVESTPRGVRVLSGALQAMDVDLGEIPDLAPVLCALLMHAQGISHLTNAARLRLKESDRLKKCCEMVCSMGGKAWIEGDGLVIQGVPSARGGVVDAGHDHRMVMAAAVAASLCTGETHILGAQAVAKSYPTFFEDFLKLGGAVHGIDDGQ